MKYTPVFMFAFFFCCYSDANAYKRRRRSLLKVHVRSPRDLQFDGNFADTLETELEDHDSNNSEGN